MYHLYLSAYDITSNTEKVEEIFRFRRWELNNLNVPQKKVLYLYKILIRYHLKGRKHVMHKRNDFILFT